MKIKTHGSYLLCSNRALQSMVFRCQNVQSIFKNSSLLNLLFKSKMAHLKNKWNGDDGEKRKQNVCDAVLININPARDRWQVVIGQFEKKKKETGSSEVYYNKREFTHTTRVKYFLPGSMLSGNTNHAFCLRLRARVLFPAKIGNVPKIFVDEVDDFSAGSVSLRTETIPVRTSYVIELVGKTKVRNQVKYVCDSTSFFTVTTQNDKGDKSWNFN